MLQVPDLSVVRVFAVSDLLQQVLQVVLPVVFVPVQEASVF